MPIEVKHLTHIYAPGTPFESRAVDDVSFTVNDGDFVGLIGHTGSGKSTLIQHLNALLKPAGGQVLVDGEDIHQPGRSLSARLKVGLVFQYPEYQLFEETVRKDVGFGPRNLGLSDAEVDARVSEALRRVGLSEGDWEKSPFELSGGQKRRAAIAGVLAMRPEFLVLDEPAAGLDPAGRSSMRALVNSLHADGTTVIMVSHSMDDVATLCNRILVMNGGRLEMDAAPAEVFRQGERLRAMHLDLPGAARLRDKLNADGFDLPADVFTVERIAEELLKRLKKGTETC
ncbi:MAG: energy-coupling factor transporter ATPase [Oscillibacter sp.]|nr:energy-coupling factor transporter ATPase [Clostridiales bacterium]MDD6999922.1 energy-coupling factor transporter ATPase [Oscillibacter sp.]